MKRRLDQDDIPIVDSPSNVSQAPSAFKSLELDPRLLQAVVRAGFSIPLAIGGTDLSGTSESSSFSSENDS